VSNRNFWLKALIFWVVFTAGYGAFRLLRQDEWRWDHLAESYVGMLIGLLIVWSLKKKPANG
jgi:hypothetical protein